MMKAFSKPPRIKSRTTPEFNQLSPGGGTAIPPESRNHPFGVIAEKPFTAKGVKPCDMLKKTFVGVAKLLGCYGCRRRFNFVAISCDSVARHLLNLTETPIEACRVFHSEHYY